MKNSNQILHTTESSLKSFLDIHAIQQLLAGVYFVLGMMLGRGERAVYRERALRVRRAVHDVRLNEYRKVNYQNYVAAWSGDERLRWNKRMWTVWQFAKADHPPRFRRIRNILRTFENEFVQTLRNVAEAQTGLRDNLCAAAPP